MAGPQHAEQLSRELGGGSRHRSQLTGRRACSNTIPGTFKERGLHVWLQETKSDSEWWEDDELNAVRCLSRPAALALRPGAAGLGPLDQPRGGGAACAALRCSDFGGLAPEVWGLGALRSCSQGQDLGLR